jgi:glycosyltransferase involved in cell wall biosynthesis
MKVLQVIPNQHFYGAERVVYNLSKGLRGAGIEVTVVTSSELQERFSRLQLSRVYALPGYSKSLQRRMFAYLRWVFELRRITSDESPDLVHVHGSLARDLLLAARPSCPVVETLHDVGLQRRQASQRLVHTLSDFLAANSFCGSIFFVPEIVGKYSRFRMRKPTAIIYNPVDQEFVSLVSTPMELPYNGKYILWCGRLNRIKGPDLLLRAFALMKEIDVKLVLIGDGPDRTILEKLANSLGIRESTLFLGFVDDVRKAQLFQHASTICVNLLRPGLSQTVLEAASTNRPVVTGYAPHVNDCFGSKFSLLRSQSVDELATVLSNNLKSKESTDCRKILEEKFSLYEFSKQHIKFYKKIVDGQS